MRHTDLGLTEPAQATSGTPIQKDDPAFQTVMESWQIRTW